MSSGSVQEYKLSPFGSSRGVSCDATGVFVSGVPLLKRSANSGDRQFWEPRECTTLSHELSRAFGLPIDISSKSHALFAMSRDLNEGDVSHAQLVALFLRIPESEPPPQARGHSRDRFIKLIQSLHANGLLKVDWNPDEHPRWPAGAPDSQGGQFAPKGTDIEASPDAATSKHESKSQAPGAAETNSQNDQSQTHENLNSIDEQSSTRTKDEEALFDPVVYRGVFHDQVVSELADHLRSMGLKVETEVPLYMADGSGGTRIDILAKGKIVFGVEVKTGEDPFPTRAQLYVYPHLMMGGSVLTDNPRIGTVGLLPLIPLPPIPVFLYYQRNEFSEPISEEFDPVKMLREFYRRYGNRPAKKVSAALPASH